MVSWGALKRTTASKSREVIVLLCPGEVTFGVLCAVQGSSIQERQGSSKGSPAEGPKDDEVIGAFHLRNL